MDKKILDKLLPLERKYYGYRGKIDFAENPILPGMTMLMVLTHDHRSKEILDQYSTSDKLLNAFCDATKELPYS
jgi:hypothetical protein